MKTNSYQKFCMANRDRVPVDVVDIRSEIEAFRENDVVWKELPMAQKLRALILERIAIAKKERERSQLPAPNFKCLLLSNYDRLSTHPKIGNRLKALAGGEPPTETEKLRIALELGVAEDIIDRLLAVGDSHATSV